MIEDLSLLFQKAFEVMQLGVTLTDPSGIILYINPADAGMHGYTSDELIGKNVRIFSTSRHWKVMSIEEMKLLKSWRRESVNRRKDGSLFPVALLSDIVLSSDGEPIGIVTICEDITDRKIAEETRRKDQEKLEKLLHDALHDPLTGLANRVLYVDRLTGAYNRARRRKGYLFAVLFMDLDNFKLINDAYGHLTGDLVLAESARRLEGCLRPVDTVARFGGDEFAVLLDDVNDEADALNIVDRIQSELHRPMKIEGKEIRITSSIGVSIGMHELSLPGDLLRQADEAMYHAKESGKAQYSIARHPLPS
jgi:diguanylate cyclase (GGDEF)-like protein/PAS domain S-box-containing protein